MAEDDASNPPGFDSGGSSFFFEERYILLLGEDGTEARVPYEDFLAFLSHLAQDSGSEDDPPEE